MRQLAVLVALFVFVGCSSNFYGKNLYISKSYSFEARRGCKLALMPVEFEHHQFIDSLMYETLNADLPIDNYLLGPQEIRQRIYGNDKLMAIIQRIDDGRYTKKQLKSMLGIGDFIDISDLSYLRQNLDSADLMLIPVEFSLKDIDNGAAGHYRFRLYDLHDGSLIYETADNIDWDLGEEACQALTGKSVKEAILNKIVSRANNEYHQLYLALGYKADFFSPFFSENHIYKAAGPCTLFITPMPKRRENAALFDTALISTFSKLPEDYVAIYGDQINQDLGEGRDIWSLMTKIITYRYTGEQLKATPNINDIITDDELIILKRLLNNRQLVMIPLGFFSETHKSTTTAMARYRLYELNDGKLIFDSAHHVTLPKKIKTREILDSLAIDVFSDFEKAILNTAQ
jgi:hypothetical protein